MYTISPTLLSRPDTLAHLNLRAVVTESEKLYHFQKAAMERAFLCPVFEHYGSIEMGSMAEPDPQGHMRLNEDMVLLERLPTGEGVMTKLFSEAYPFIRYKQGDIIDAILPPAPGLPYAVVSGIVGRTADLIPLRSGGCTPGRALTYVIDSHIDHIAKYQIHQTAIDRFTVRIIPRGELPKHVEPTIARDLRSVLGQDARVDFVLVDDIPPAPSGKYRWIISDIAAQAQPETMSEPLHTI